MKTYTLFKHACLVALLLAFAVPTRATIHMVLSGTDALTPTPGMLRYAIENAASGDTVLFSPSLANTVITLVAPINIENKDLIIIAINEGPTLSGNNAGRIFRLVSSDTNTIGFANIRFMRGIAPAGDESGTASEENDFNELSGSHGGAIFANSGITLKLSFCTFEQNTAGTGMDGGWGGALYCAGDAEIICCSFTANRAGAATDGIGGKGGAVAVTGTLNLANCLIANNTAGNGDFGGVGGGIYTEGTANLLNCTVVRNQAAEGVNESGDGGGAFFNGTTTAIQNCIFWGNEVENVEASQIGANFSPVITYSAIEDGFAGNHIINLSPVNTASGTPKGPNFVNPSPEAGYDTEVYNWSLSYNSPCFEAGDPATSALLTGDLDLIGNSRFSFDFIDMGAYEAILPILSGTYTIDNTQATNFPSGTNFASVGEAVNFIEFADIQGNVTFKVKAGQQFDESVLRLKDTGSESEVITFVKDGSGANPLIRITGNKNTGIADPDAGFVLNDCNYIIIDGISVKNHPDNLTNTQKIEAGFYLRNASHITIRNCEVESDTFYTISGTAFTVGIYATATGTNENSHNRFENNTLKYGFMGIHISGDQLAGQNNVIEGGTITGAGFSTALSEQHIVSIDNQNNMSIKNVSISGYRSNSNENQVGIYAIRSEGTIENLAMTNMLANQSLSGIQIDEESSLEIIRCSLCGLTSSQGDAFGVLFDSPGTHASHAQIDRNSLCNIVSNSSTGFASGMSFKIAGNRLVTNNMIAGIAAPLSANVPSTAAISCMAGNDSLIHNTLLLNYSAQNADNVSAVIDLGSTASVLIRNSICVNNTSGTYGQATVIRSAVSNFSNINATSDANIYFCGQLAGGVKQFVYADATNQHASLIAYRSAIEAFHSNAEKNSQAENPPFVSISFPYDLHLASSAPTLAESGGSFLVAGSDYDGQPRTGLTPDIGADEGNFVAYDLTIEEVTPSIIFTNATTEGLFQIDYTINGNYLTGNKFEAYISLSSTQLSGSIKVGSLTATGAGTIFAAVPAGTSVNNTYWVHVYPTNPAKGGDVSGPITLTDVNVVNALPSSQLVVFPNPFTSILQVSSTSPVDRVILCDMQGRVLLDRSAREAQSIDTQNIEKGAYIIRCFASGRLVASKPVIKE